MLLLIVIPLALHNDSKFLQHHALVPTASRNQHLEWKKGIVHNRPNSYIE